MPVEIKRRAMSLAIRERDIQYAITYKLWRYLLKKQIIYNRIR